MFQFVCYKFDFGYAQQMKKKQMRKLHTGPCTWTH